MTMPDDPHHHTDSSSSAAVRGLTVRDAMILVAAAAVGALGYRVNYAVMTERGFHLGDPEFDVQKWAILTAPGLAALTAGLITARLLPPRPTRCELFRQPGFAAGCVALVVVAGRFVEYVLIDRLIEFDDWFLAMEWIGATEQVAVCIAITWPALALAGCLKAERGWIDRALRALAMVWVLAGIAARLVPVFQFWLWER
jgi:hypothetical protein